MVQDPTCGPGIFHRLQHRFKAFRAHRLRKAPVGEPPGPLILKALQVPGGLLRFRLGLGKPRPGLGQMVLGLAPVLFPGLPVPKLRRGLLQFPGDLLQDHDVGRRLPVHDLRRPGNLGLRRLDLPGPVR